MPTVPIFYECEIPDSHQNICIVKTKSSFDDLTVKLILNNFSDVKIDFRVHKNRKVGTYDISDD